MVVDSWYRSRVNCYLLLCTVNKQVEQVCIIVWQVTHTGNHWEIYTEREKKKETWVHVHTASCASIFYCESAYKIVYASFTFHLKMFSTRTTTVCVCVSECVCTPLLIVSSRSNTSTSVNMKVNRIHWIMGDKETTETGENILSIFVTATNIQWPVYSFVFSIHLDLCMCVDCYYFFSLLSQWHQFTCISPLVIVVVDISCNAKPFIF